jgi:hypothetical protein
MVHATVGIRALAGFGAGGRSPRIPWTSRRRQHRKVNRWLNPAALAALEELARWPDNEFMGASVAQALVNAIGGKGTMIMTQDALGHTGTQGRALSSRKAPASVQRFADLIAAAYPDALADALAETSLRPQTFPATCPFTTDQILDACARKFQRRGSPPNCTRPVVIFPTRLVAHRTHESGALPECETPEARPHSEGVT